MKYIPIDPETSDYYAEIWLEFAISLNPHIDEARALELMQEFFQLNPTFDARGAALLGQIVKHTEDTWASRETH